MNDASSQETTRTFYDTIADDYVQWIKDELATKPYDRAMLSTFAELVDTRQAPVADLGCGPGRIAAYLDTLGVNVFGIDLSPAMIEHARRDYPHLRFDVGSITALNLADASVAGVVAWYSVIHTPLAQLPLAFAEFHRVLAPGGHLLMAFQAGEDTFHLAEPMGHPVSLDFNRLSPDQIAEMLGEAGLVTHARLVREPDEAEVGEKVPQAYLMARKPTAP